jgi:hypothetical protein
MTPQRRMLSSTLLLTTYALLGVTCGRTLETVPVGGSFDAPIFVAAPIGDARLFVVERAGVIRVLDANGPAG